MKQLLQTRFTFGRHITENPFHVPIITTRLTKAIPGLVPDVFDEMVAACDEYLPAKEGIYFLKILGIHGSR
jgi:hypothetical protein